jgi:prefoldin subunit 5
MCKQLRENIRMMSHQIENVSEKTKILRRNHMEIMELKSTITEAKKKSQEGCKSRFEQAEESVNLKIG